MIYFFDPSKIIDFKAQILVLKSRPVKIATLVFFFVKVFLPALRLTKVQLLLSFWLPQASRQG